MASVEVNNYDVIVVGSGVGGLTSAGLLARAGQKVLVLERHDRPGGYVHGFRRKRWVFDAGVHLTSGCGFQGFRGGQVIRKVLQALEVFDQIEFIKIDPFSVVHYPGFSLALPQTIAAFVETLGDLYPQQRQGLTHLMALCLQVTEELASADEVLAETPGQAQTLLPGLLRYRKSTLAEVYDEFISDPELQAIFATHWPYLGLPPKRVSFVYWASMLIGYLEDGAYYCVGGFQRFAETLVNGLQNHGGEISFKSSVQKININDGRVMGVTVASGETINAPIVIANADMRQTVFKLIGEQHFTPKFLAKLSRSSASLSIFVVYITTNLDLTDSPLEHESFCYSDIDHQRNFEKTKNADISWISITIPTLADRSLAPKGQHVVMLTTLAPHALDGASWQQQKPKFTERMIAMAEQYLPGLQQHILFMESGSPTTMQRYTLNDQGSAYGWEVSPEQVGQNRFSNRGPIDGLYFTGHWSSPGGGVYGVSVSGMQTAQQVLKITKQDDFWAHLNTCSSVQKPRSASSAEA